MLTWEQTLDRYEAAFGIRPGVGPDSERVGYLESLWTYCRNLLPKPAIVIEIGCFRGKSTAIMALALKGTGSRIITIDPVFATGEFSCSDPCPEGRTTYSSSIRNVLNRWALMGISSMISVVPLDSNSALATWDGTVCDMVLVDGNHSSWAVTQDSEWSRYLNVGALMCYDDWISEVRASALLYFADKPQFELIYESTSPPPDGHPQWAITLFRRCQ